MTKKHFIALANCIKHYNQHAFPAGTNCVSPLQFGHTQLLVLADWCEAQNPRFNRQRWFDYINGQCGPNGGAIKSAKENR